MLAIEIMRKLLILRKRKGGSNTVRRPAFIREIRGCFEPRNSSSLAALVMTI